MMNDYKEIFQTIAGLLVAGLSGFILAAFRKASRQDLKELENKMEDRLRERQVYTIEPIKTQISGIESKLIDCITAREIDIKFDALERRLDDILALITRRHD